MYVCVGVESVFNEPCLSLGIRSSGLLLCSSMDADKAVILNASSLTSSFTREQTMFLLMVLPFFFFFRKFLMKPFGKPGQ